MNNWIGKITTTTYHEEDRLLLTLSISPIHLTRSSLVFANALVILVAFRIIYPLRGEKRDNTISPGIQDQPKKTNNIATEPNIYTTKQTYQNIIRYP